MYASTCICFITEMKKKKNIVFTAEFVNSLIKTYNFSVSFFL